LETVICGLCQTPSVMHARYLRDCEIAPALRNIANLTNPWNQPPVTPIYLYRD